MTSICGDLKDFHYSLKRISVVSGRCLSVDAVSARYEYALAFLCRNAEAPGKNSFVDAAGFQYSMRLYYGG